MIKRAFIAGIILAIIAGSAVYLGISNSNQAEPVNNDVATDLEPVAIEGQDIEKMAEAGAETGDVTLPEGSDSDISGNIDGDISDMAFDDDGLDLLDTGDATDVAELGDTSDVVEGDAASYGSDSETSLESDTSGQESDTLGSGTDGDIISGEQDDVSQDEISLEAENTIETPSDTAGVTDLSDTGFEYEADAATEEGNDPEVVIPDTEQSEAELSNDFIYENSEEATETQSATSEAGEETPSEIIEESEEAVYDIEAQYRDAKNDPSVTQQDVVNFKVFEDSLASGNVQFAQNVAENFSSYKLREIAREVAKSGLK